MNIALLDKGEFKIQQMQMLMAGKNTHVYIDSSQPFNGRYD